MEYTKIPVLHSFELALWLRRARNGVFHRSIVDWRTWIGRILGLRCRRLGTRGSRNRAIVAVFKDDGGVAATADLGFGLQVCFAALGI